ncbi:MAG: hypothetical protein ABIE36_01090 [Candidatus Diapherotrites archaeon]
MEKIGQIYVFDRANIPSCELRINHSSRTRSLEEECLGLYDQTLSEDIRDRAASYGNHESGQFDGKLLCLRGFKVNQDNSRTLYLCDVNYSTYQALKARLDKEPEHKHTLTRTAPIIGIAETSDGMLILGHRSTQHMPDRYLPPAGFTDHNGQIDETYFAHLAKEEIEEEVGVNVEPNSIRYIGLTAGDDSRNNTITLYTHLPFDMESVERTFSELNQKLVENREGIEHKHLIYLPSDLESVKHFLCGNYTGNLNPLRDIRFDQGICVSGPEEILGKQYKQIGNGMASLLCFIQNRVSHEAYSSLVQEIEASGIVEGVEHLDINEKLGLCTIR